VTDAVGDFVTAIMSGAGAAAPDGASVGGAAPDDSIAPKDLRSFGNKEGIRRLRPGIDYDVDEDGNVIPQSGKEPKGLSSYDDPEKAPLTGQYHKLPEGAQLPSELGVTLDGSDVVEGSPHPPGHATIYPKVPMTPERYQELLDGLPWQYEGKKKK
jgi:hypothetical protein